MMQINTFLRPERTGFFPNCIVHVHHRIRTGWGMAATATGQPRGIAPTHPILPSSTIAGSATGQKG
ncbi:MAG TPA: hypothetical protein VKY19_09410 [Ktedonosporobacter sp.]|nr:hypothetical protein [Ktedonosporobacter sp.]